MVVVTVIVAVPLAFAVTFPESLTWATFGLLLFQVRDVLLPDGERTAFKVFEEPSVIVTLPLLNFTEDGAFRTVTVHFAVTLPAFALISAVPPFLAVTLPEALTLATLALLLDQVISSSALAGRTVPASCRVAPAFKVAFVLFKRTSVTFGRSTVTVHTACFPSADRAVILAVP